MRIVEVALFGVLAHEAADHRALLWLICAFAFGAHPAIGAALLGTWFVLWAVYNLARAFIRAIKRNDSGFV